MSVISELMRGSGEVDTGSAICLHFHLLARWFLCIGFTLSATTWAYLLRASVKYRVVGLRTFEKPNLTLLVKLGLRAFTHFHICLKLLIPFC